jgi:hypothetical protein
LTGQDATALSYAIGAQVATGIAAGVGGQIFSPAGERELPLSDLAGATHFVPEQTGFYEIRTEGRRHWVAVNVDSRESDLAKMQSDAVERWQHLTPAPTPRETSSEATAPIAPRSIGWPLLVFAALVLLSELLLANYRLTIRRDGSRAGEVSQ